MTLDRTERPMRPARCREQPRAFVHQLRETAMQTRIYLLALGVAFSTSSVHAVDATSTATKTLTLGKWQVIEFAAPKQVIYRVSSDSINFSERHIVFDFIPSKQCVPMPAVMIIKRDAYNPDLDDGRVILTHKFPGQSEVSELTKSAMQQGDTFAFFQFTNLTAAKLLASKDRGNLELIRKLHSRPVAPCERR